MRLLVIDGNSIANRAFYGIKLLTTKDGRYTNAIYGFLNILLSLLKECQPDEVAVAFDLKAPTFRHKMYDGYKATRHAMPEELAQQMPVLKQLLADLGYRTVTAEGWEADDILGTLAAACAARKDDCFLATGDRDSLQLVSESTTVLLAATVMGRSKTVVMDEDAIQEKYGLAPKQLIEVKSLMGDTSDNIPGVKGIGEKTALSLVQAFGSLEGVYQNIDDKRIKPKQREHLLEDKPMAELSHTLGTIRTDAPIDTAEGSYTVGEGNKPAAVRLLQELEIHSLIPRFGLDGVAPEAAAEEETVELPEAELTPLPLTPAGHYLAAFPSVSGYMDKTIADAKANGYVSTLFGRRRTLPELASTNFNVRASGERMARNTPIQGTAADVIKLAMVRVWKRLRDEKMASRLILTVHDELIVEAPEAEAEQAARILREEMEGCVQYAVPLSTDVHAGKNWLEAH